MSDSRISGLYKLSVTERINRLRDLGWLSAADAACLRGGYHVLSAQAADHMIENAVGVFGMPFAVAPNFVINGRECLVPLVVEEPSIVAGLSSAAALARSQGGFEVENDGSLLIGQVHVTGVADADRINKSGCHENSGCRHGHHGLQRGAHRRGTPPGGNQFGQHPDAFPTLGWNDR